jgi:hypothetical protein
MTLRRVFGFVFHASVLVALISGSNSSSSPIAQEAAVNMTCDNWDFEPIWDDLQALCKTGASHTISTNAAIAASQGTASADAASSALAARGLRTP